MNLNWKNFLIAENAIFNCDTNIAFSLPKNESNKHIYPISHLGILTVSGVDAAKFLQGQITCNINEISNIKSSLGAICNPKGRAITTFLLIKNSNDFLLILPHELLALVKKRLEMYVLRSAVTLTDSSDELCLIGLSNDAQQPSENYNFATNRQENIIVKLKKRNLIIAINDHAQTFWSEQLKQGFQPEDSEQWRYLDIMSGIPWLTATTSEEFIPQMLNLDKLGGISFNKGCYTGQEIVARTHYLGKTKREMFLVEYDGLEDPEPNSTIIDDSTGTEKNIGKVLYAQSRHNSCKMLIILQVSDTNTYNLKLKNYNSNKITLLKILY